MRVRRPAAGKCPAAAVDSYYTTVNFQSGSKVYASGGNCNIGASIGGNYSQTMNVSGTVTNMAQLNVNRLGYLNINSGGLWLNAGAVTMIGVGGFGDVIQVNPGGSFIYTGSSAIQVDGAAGNGACSTVTINGGTFTTGQGFTNINSGAKSLGFGEIIFTNNGTLMLSANIPQLASWLNTNSVPTIWLTNGGGAINLGGFSTLITNCLIAGNGSLTVLGGGTLTLGATNTCTGSTTISSGTLKLGAGGSIPNSPAINLVSNAVFDVSAVSGGFTLGASQILSGSGSINGNVTALAGSQINPGGTGAGGTLVFSNNLALNNGSLTFNLSANPASGNSQLQVMGTLTNNGTTVINLDYLAGSLGVGTYTLITYPALAGGGTFAWAQTIAASL